MKKILSFLITICFGMFFLETNAAGKVFYNISTSVGEDIATQVNINYHTDVEGTFVEYTLASDTSFSSATRVTGTYETFKAPVGANLVGFGERFRVRVRIYNLTPDTKYMYRVGKEGNFSESYYFSTAKEGAFSFLHITDPQYYSESTAAIFNNLMTQAFTINPDIAFTFFTGDIVDKGGDESQWEMFYKQSNLKRQMIATVPGNHEYYDAHGSGSYFGDFYQVNYNNPDNGAHESKNTSYFFKYNDTLFVALNTEEKSQANQKAWFELVMKLNTDVKYVIVGMHRSMYGSIYASDSVTVRSNWLELFDKYGVDLVLSGHDHIYSRSFRLYNGVKSSDPAKGTTYIIGGSGGQKFYPITESPMYAKSIANTSCANIITISENGISINLIDSSGKTIDTLTDESGNPTTIKSKRIGNVDQNFNKEEFISQITVEQSKVESSVGVITWPKSAYQNVINVQVNNYEFGYAIKGVFMYHENLNTFNFTGVTANKLNKFKVVVTYKDLSTSELEFEINTVIPPKPVYLRITEVLDLCKVKLDGSIKNIFE